jgi:putative transposase
MYVEYDIIYSISTERLFAMLIRQGFQYAPRLKAQREALVRRWVGCRRFVFNDALRFQRAEIAAGRKRPGYTALCRRLPDLRKAYPWLGEPPAQALQQALKDLCAAWDRKFKSKFGAPRFKEKGKGDTIRFPQDCTYDAAAGVVRLPKLGDVRLRHSRPALGKLKNVTLRFDGKRLVVALQTERELDVPAPAGTGEVGLDFGAVTTISPSTGAPIKLPSRIGRYERRMKRLQQAVSRKKSYSNNRRKAVARVAECHRRRAAIRRDFLHQETTNLVSHNALIAIEDLRVKNMTASAAGTIEAPGKNVRQKAGLNRTILRNGWSMARSMLEYKAAWRGSVLAAVPPAYTSQQCSCCGRIAAENRRTQALFECVECGHTENADRNAAPNILLRGKELVANQTRTGGCPSSTAGYAGTHACEGAQRKLRHPRPRSAAQGSAVGLPLAGAVSELSLSGNLHAWRA